ncbi:unnamed protein product [Chilo suppressalis]|uniref:DUF7869 domain-containing protein n=1 Tax=Chilo suppressalis TaxID=168631 RepID=A0ABN8AT58_CHISP|nr:unnamed protein product [Chilo suppressalis]
MAVMAVVSPHALVIPRLRIVWFKLRQLALIAVSLDGVVECRAAQSTQEQDVKNHRPAHGKDVSSGSRLRTTRARTICEWSERSRSADFNKIRTGGEESDFLRRQVAGVNNICLEGTVNTLGIQSDYPTVNVLYLQLINKRRKLANLREKIIGSKEGSQEARIDHLETYGEPVSVAKYQEQMNSEVSMNAFAGMAFDYDSDDSVKDKTYDPSKDCSDDDSYISNSPEHDIPQSRRNLVKKNLFTPDKSLQNQINNNDLITLDDLLNTTEKYQEPGTSFDISGFDNQIKMAQQIVSMDSSEDVINNTCQKYPNNVIDNTQTSIYYNEPIPSATNNIHEDNCEFALCRTVSAIPLDEERHNIKNNIMVVDMNGNIYIQNEIITDNINMQQSHRTPLKVNCRKKQKQVDKWKRVVSKVARLKGSPYHSTVAKKKPNVEGRQLKPPCACRHKCYEKIPDNIRLQIFKEFWKTCSSWDQRRQFLANHITKEPKHLMKTNGNLDTDRRKFTYIYRLVVNSESQKVCKVMFLNTLCIGDKFLKLSLVKQLDCGLVAPDQRGKHIPSNKSPAVVIQSVIDHINMYPNYESHYSREKSKRKFLGPNLNVPTMYKQYKEWMAEKEIPSNLVAKDWLYRNIFNTKFNLSFKLPSVDTCDDCDAYQRKLLDAKDEETKEIIEKDKEVHDIAAEERYKLKKKDKSEADSSLGEKKVLMFDLQKCMATPNLTNCKSFYLRKLWTLNLTIFDSTSNIATNVIWSENISGRGGNEVASCLIRWANENMENIVNVRELTFWSDNCAGQNRNLMVVLAYMWLLHKCPQLKIISHKFMLKGHTHMEVDQIHSQIEQKKRRLKTMQIAVPQDWSQFIQTCGGKRKFDVFEMQSHHFKDLTDFSEVSLIRNISKKTALPEDLPQLRLNEKPISTAKYNDLMTLLQWIPEELHGFYKNLSHSNNASDFPETDD